MANRVKHRRDALARRVERIAQDPNLPADPSNRTRAPRRSFACTDCPAKFRQHSDALLHLNLRGHKVSAA